MQATKQRSPFTLKKINLKKLKATITLTNLRNSLTCNHLAKGVQGLVNQMHTSFFRKKRICK